MLKKLRSRAEHQSKKALIYFLQEGLHNFPSLCAYHGIHLRLALPSEIDFMRLSLSSTAQTTNTRKRNAVVKQMPAILHSMM
jgi:hypothetical protein